MRQLWCQLALSFTLLSYCALILLFVTLLTIHDYRDFHRTFTPDNIETLLESEERTVAQAIQHANNPEWLSIARDSVREKLINIEYGTGVSIYRLSNSSHPEVYLRIADQNGRTLLSDPVDWPADIESVSGWRGMMVDARAVARWLIENESVWVDMPVADSDGTPVGQLVVMFRAEFDPWLQGQTIFDFLLQASDALFFFCLPIGIACSLIASRYVKMQLQKMNEVTENWRQGNFEARIALPNDDVLIRHSEHLNEMAQDLEMYMSLKQNLAVTDERTRVARELHDTVKQKLFALGLQLATSKAKPAVMDAASEHILEAETINREAQHDLMEIITQLRPAGTDMISLYDRIEAIAEDFRRRFDIAIDIRTLGPMMCDAHTEHNVVRIVQEALMNAIRHGRASKIKIKGDVDQGRIRLQVYDNGSGFDTSHKSNGFGLISMKDRASDLPKGSITIESSMGVGTEITLSWAHEI